MVLVVTDMQNVIETCFEVILAHGHPQSILRCISFNHKCLKQVQFSCVELGCGCCTSALDRWAGWQPGGEGPQKLGWLHGCLAMKPHKFHA